MNLFRPRPQAPYVDIPCTRCNKWLRVGWKVDIRKEWRCPFCGNGIGDQVERQREKHCPRRGKDEGRIVNLTKEDRDATHDGHTVFLNILRDLCLDTPCTMAEAHRIYDEKYRPEQ